MTFWSLITFTSASNYLRIHILAILVLFAEIAKINAGEKIYNV